MKSVTGVSSKSNGLPHRESNYDVYQLSQDAEYGESYRVMTQHLYCCTAGLADATLHTSTRNFPREQFVSQVCDPGQKQPTEKTLYRLRPQH